MILDTFMINGAGPELDMLECRLVELENIPNLVHIAVEADVDHQDHPKPYLVTENIDRYAPWKERLIVIRATDLPNARDFPDPWAREHAQREWCAVGLRQAGASNGDVVLHGDLDEIPNPLVVRNVRPRGMVSFQMTWCSFAVDWVCPSKWYGTVAGIAGSIDSFGYMRDRRNIVANSLPNAGFHLGWLGGNEANWRKLRSFCHPELELRISDGLTADQFLRQGMHVDGQKMAPVDIDNTWPRYVRERRCPSNWFRPR